jgi:hypothetical protein
MKTIKFFERRIEELEEDVKKAEDRYTKAAVNNPDAKKEMDFYISQTKSILALNKRLLDLFNGLL